jgi:hypothetical protein
MRRSLVTALAVVALAATTLGAVQVTAQDGHAVCIHPAVIHALS